MCRATKDGMQRKSSCLVSPSLAWPWRPLPLPVRSRSPPAWRCRWTCAPVSRSAWPTGPTSTQGQATPAIAAAGTCRPACAGGLHGAAVPDQRHRQPRRHVDRRDHRRPRRPRHLLIELSSVTRCRARPAASSPTIRASAASIVKCSVCPPCRCRARVASPTRSARKAISAQCEYVLSGPSKGTGACVFSDGARYQLHFG